MKTSLIASMLALTLAGTSQSFAGSGPDPANIVVDTVLVRPVCLAATIVGSALFVISLPVAATSKSVHIAAQALVVKPAHATFKRRLGDVDEMLHDF